MKQSRTLEDLTNVPPLTTSTRERSHSAPALENGVDTDFSLRILRNAIEEKNWNYVKTCTLFQVHKRDIIQDLMAKDSNYVLIKGLWDNQLINHHDLSHPIEYALHAHTKRNQLDKVMLLLDMFPNELRQYCDFEVLEHAVRYALKRKQLDINLDLIEEVVKKTDNPQMTIDAIVMCNQNPALHARISDLALKKMFMADISNYHIECSTFLNKFPLEAVAYQLKHTRQRGHASTWNHMVSYVLEKAAKTPNLPVRTLFLINSSLPCLEIYDVEMLEYICKPHLRHVVTLEGIQGILGSAKQLLEEYITDLKSICQPLQKQTKPFLDQLTERKILKGNDEFIKEFNESFHDFLKNDEQHQSISSYNINAFAIKQAPQVFNFINHTFLLCHCLNPNLTTPRKLDRKAPNLRETVGQLPTYYDLAKIPLADESINKPFESLIRDNLALCCQLIQLNISEDIFNRTCSRIHNNSDEASTILFRSFDNIKESMTCFVETIIEISDLTAWIDTVSEILESVGTRPRIIEKLPPLVEERPPLWQTSVAEGRKSPSPVERSL
ncbi:MAG: hypothetical protein IPP74_04985 [Alphaproteobacteria bacterium]|nr:hypothetical protein [Alphaproteobacteria bacterium]